MHRVRPRSLLFALAAAALAGPLAGAGGAQPAATPVRAIEVSGPIDRPLLRYLDERLDEAEEAGAVVVLQLDSPGALGQDGLALADRVAAMEVPVLTWVGPVPARASGAGLLLMLASSLAGVAPGSQTGPLEPIDVLHPGPLPDGTIDTVEGWLADHGREVALDDLARPLTAQEALDAGVAEVAAYSVPEFLGAVDGRTVRTASGEVTLATRVATSQAEADEGHGRDPVRGTRPGRARPARGLDAVDGLLPARARPRGARVRADPARGSASPASPASSSRPSRSTG